MSKRDPTADLQEARAWANSPEGLKAFADMEEKQQESEALKAQRVGIYRYDVPEAMRVLRWEDRTGGRGKGKRLVFRTQTATVLASSDPRTFGRASPLHSSRRIDVMILYVCPNGHYVKRHYYNWFMWTGERTEETIEPLSVDEAMTLYEDLVYKPVGKGSTWETAFDGTIYEEP